MEEFLYSQKWSSFYKKLVFSSLTILLPSLVSGGSYITTGMKYFSNFSDLNAPLKNPQSKMLLNIEILKLVIESYFLDEFWN